MSFHNENTKVGIEGNSLNENGTNPLYLIESSWVKLIIQQ